MENDRKPYSGAFKAEVVKMITDGGASVGRVAADMDIPLKLLYRWIRELSAKPEEVFPGKGRITSDAEIIRRLQRENERLRLECEVLKQAQEGSAKDPG